MLLICFVIKKKETMNTYLVHCLFVTPCQSNVHVVK